MAKDIIIGTDVDVRIKEGKTLSSFTSAFKTLVLKPHLVQGNNVLTQEMIDEGGSNTKFVIKVKYILNGTITMPENSILEFDGGSFSDGILVGNDTKIINLYDYNILDNVVKEGTFKHITAILEI